MYGRAVLAATVLAALMTAAGCGGPTRSGGPAPLGEPTRVGGAPPGSPRDSFVYKPLECRSPRDIPVKTPPAKPLRLLPVEPSMPEHDAAWDVAGQQRLWRWIVVHHSASRRGSAALIDSYHRNSKHWDELGYHFVIGNGSASGDGQIEVGSRWPKQKHGAHTKVGQDETYNDYGIGICLVGDFEKTRPSAEQMDSLARLVDYLAARCRIDDAHVIGHGDVDDTRCPGRNFSFPDLSARLQARRAQRSDVVSVRGPSAPAAPVR